MFELFFKLSGRTAYVLFIATGLLLLSAFFGKASADEYHYNSTIIGERAGGMGGAYVAVSDDTAGVYYNPAGIVLASGNSVSASENTYLTQNKVYKGVLGSNDYQRSSSNIQPNFFGVIQHTPYGSIGVSYVIPNSLLQQQDQTYWGTSASTQSYTYNFNNQLNTYDTGLTYANDATKNLKIGLTLYFHYKTLKTIVNNFETDCVNNLTNLNLVNCTANPTTLTSLNQSTYFKDEEYGVRPILGFLWAPDDGKYSVGLTLSQTLIYQANQYKQYTSSSGSSLLPVTIKYYGSIPTYPMEVKVGYAYFPSNALLLSADVSYYSQTSSDPIVYTWTRIPVMNLAVGAEYFLSPKFALRTGLYTDNSNVDSAGLAAGALDMVNLYGMALSGTWFTKASSITLGLNYSQGSGSSNIGGNGINYPLAVSTLNVFLGTSYSY
ncbi:MAG: hypothetical protein HY280_07450 [Nitrospinae bacterium]|nr:hypothetical protein [Nitrospinota bacterium]